MPTTVNGIGTTYFGKRNRRQYEGTCRFCNRPGRLENYETWLVFSVVFIPIVPLGKKQILQKCPRCTRHIAIAYSAWQHEQKKAVEASAAELARSSHDPDAAIRMHATYDAYQMHDDVARFADAMLTLYGDVARVQFYLAAWFERLGRKEQAQAGFDAAYRLQPDNLTYQRAIAIGHIERGRLEEAERLLRNFRPPAAAFEPQLFVLLANAYHVQGRYEQAMEQFKMLTAARPELANDRYFRNAVRRTERAMGTSESLVGREPFYRSRGVLVGLGAAVLIAALVGVNAYARSHRKLYVVNGLPVPLSVKIDESTVVGVPARGHKQLPISEGRHTAVVKQPELAVSPVEFEVASNWLTGAFRDPAYVVDPARSAALVYEEVSYGPPGDNVPPGERRWHIGESMVTFPSVDYAFLPFPQQVQLNRHKQVRKSRVDMMTLTPMQLVMLLSVSPEMSNRALPLAEVHLQAAPDDQMLLFAYWGLGLRQKELDRCAKFVATRLADRPVRVDWHRAWQSIRQEQDADSEVVAQCDAWLNAEPDNSALIYLRGRCERDVETSLGYYQRAVAVDAANAYPQFAQSVVWFGRGDLSRARQAAEQAVRLRPNDFQMKRNLNQIRFAQGEFDELEKDLRNALATEPWALADHQQLLGVLVTQGKDADAAEQVQAIIQQAGQQQPQQVEVWRRRLQNELLYMQGKFDELLSATASPANDADVAAWHQMAEFELGQITEPPAAASPEADGEEPYLQLCQALALSERGEQEAAQEARGRAIESLRQGLREQRDAADVLSKANALSQNDLDHLPHDARLRAITLVSLVDASDEHDARLLDLAATLNFDRRFPFHFLRRSIDRLRGSPQAERTDAGEVGK